MLTRLRNFFSQKISFKFLVATSTAITVIFVLVFFWFSRQQEDHIMEQVKKQAIILHKQIVLTRQWAADSQTVLIPKTPETRSSPFLEKPDVQGSDGTTYTKISPSVLTKALSERAARSGTHFFRLTNTDLLNPNNSADGFELEALRLFRSSEQDSIFRMEEIDGKAVLRYVAPLYVAENCLQCHMTQNYRIGEVGGCLSVFIPMDEAKSAINRNRAILLGGGVAFALCLVMLVFLFARSLLFKRIQDIRVAMSRLPITNFMGNADPQGDELKNIADFCYILDEKMKTQHEELEKKISDATRDLSETNRDLEKANRELESLNRAKSEFFSDISHELRTPLTSIKGAADIMGRKASGGNLEYVDIIKRNTDHLVKIVLDFLDFSKIESGQLDLDLRKSSIREVAEEAIFSQKATAEKKDLHFALNSPDNLLPVFDRKRMYQVLTNLLSNAVRFSPVSGTITVDVGSDRNNFVKVAVHDQGPGIDEKYHAAIFRKFYQVKDQGKNIHQGSSGIGLAICKGIMEAHGGRIWVESRPGSGSTFVFTLPNDRPANAHAHLS
ncbi:MAG TPA: ATP-binding protein [Desulfomonilaceae bacterium]|nr:ATP-binding protein [Desulfomonilaceae bacterium]